MENFSHFKAKALSLKADKTQSTQMNANEEMAEIMTNTGTMLFFKTLDCKGVGFGTAWCYYYVTLYALAVKKCWHIKYKE